VEEQATTTKTNWRVLARAQTVYENRSALTGAGPTAGAGFGIQTTAIASRVHAAVAGSPESPQGGSSELKEDALLSLVGSQRILVFNDEKVSRQGAKERRKHAKKAQLLCVRLFYLRALAGNCFKSLAE
jgi:hypothetical protein